MLGFSRASLVSSAARYPSQCINGKTQWNVNVIIRYIDSAGTGGCFFVEERLLVSILQEHG